MIESLPAAAEQLRGSSQLSEIDARGCAVGQPLHMHSWGLDGTKTICMEQLIEERDGGGQWVESGDACAEKNLKR